MFMCLPLLNCSSGSNGNITTDGGITDSGVTDGGPQNVTDKGIVMGKITNDGLSPIGNVTVTVDNKTVTSNEQGFFVIEDLSPGNDKTITFKKSGYTPGAKSINVVAKQQSFANLRLKEVGISAQANNSTGATVSDNRSDGRNGSVTIPANTVVNAAGTAVTSYTVELTTLQPSDTNYTSLFPGSFMGGTSAGSAANPKPIVSYGVVVVDLKDTQGNKLSLANSAKATINFPIDSSQDPGTPTIPLWYLPDGSSTWVQEGTATRNGSVYTGQVSHFTPWNCDQLLNNSSIKTVDVVGLDGTPVNNAYVIVEGTGYSQQGYTGNAGSVDIITAAGDSIRVWAEKGTLKSEVTTEIAAPVGQVKRNRIELVEPLVSITMSWGQNPSDLDSHLTGPLTSTSNRFHVWYPDKGSLSISPYAGLDTDDTSSYGPEIMTITKLLSGTYRYSVHNFSSQSDFRMENSNCVVNVVIPKTGTIRRYNIPTNNSTNGNLWEVFELNVGTGSNVTLTDINQFKTVGETGEDIK